MAALCALVFRTMYSKTHREEQISQITFDAGLTIDPAVSPDGKLLAYASDRPEGRNLNIWVQQLAPGGSAVQLTHEDAEARQPSFSPDGTQIVFHCAKDGGGICMIPAIGGQIVRLAPRGAVPRVSPDGKWISFQAGTNLGSIITGNGVGQSFVMPASGGSAREIGSDLRSTANPVWSPDSQHLLIYEEAGDSSDWFLISTAGGRPRRVGLGEALKRQGFSVLGLNHVPQVAEWQRGFVLFSADYGDTTNVWRMPVSGDGTPAGKAERLTSGTGIETSPILSASGDLVFQSLSTLYSIWSLPLDANQGVVRGEWRRVTSGPFDILPSSSLDGRWLAYTTGRGKKASIYNARVDVKDLDTGTDTVISDASTAEAHPRLSSDGSIAIATSPPNWDRIRLVERRNLAEQWIAGAAHPKDLSHDNKRLLYGTNEGEIRCRDIASGKEVFQLQDPKYNLYQAEFAPGDRFVAVEAVDKPGYGINSRLFVVPFGKQDWIAIDHGGLWDDKPRWSPDGRYSILFRTATAISAFGRGAWTANPNGQQDAVPRPALPRLRVWNAKCWCGFSRD